MESFAVGFANKFKGLSKAAFGITTGKIVDGLPDILIQIGDEILLDSSKLIIANRVYTLELNAGDMVILIPTTNGQSYYLIDKVGV